MISYFVPISLLVLAGFGLGLLVGRLTWASSKSAAARKTGAPEAPTVTQEGAPTSSRPASHGRIKDLPVWRIREVPASEHPPVKESQPIDVNPGKRQPNVHAKGPRPRQAASKTSGTGLVVDAATLNRLDREANRESGQPNYSPVDATGADGPDRPH